MPVYNSTGTQHLTVLVYHNKQMPVRTHQRDVSLHSRLSRTFPRQTAKKTAPEVEVSFNLVM